MYCGIIVTTSCHTVGSQRPHHCCSLMSKVESVDCGQTGHIQLLPPPKLPFSRPGPYLHTHQFNSPFSLTTRVSQYQKGKTNLDFTEARDGEWQWHQLGYIQVCTSLQTDNHTSTPPLSFLQAGCPSCHPTNGIRALKAPPNK